LVSRFQRPVPAELATSPIYGPSEAPETVSEDLEDLDLGEPILPVDDVVQPHRSTPPAPTP